jgi:hypothetical protein
MMSYLLNLILLISFIPNQKDICSDTGIVYEISDSINYTDFQIIYSYCNGADRFSSFDSIFSRAYLNGTKKVKLIITPRDKQRIFEVVKLIDFFGLPKYMPEKFENCSLPCFSTEIIIKIGKEIKRVNYSGHCDILDKSIEKRFNFLNEIIKRIIFDKKVVKKLPHSDITYE